MKEPIIALLTLAVLLAGGLPSTAHAAHPQDLPRSEWPLVWTMINVNQTDVQNDAHLLLFPSGKKVLIDAGDAPGSTALLDYLKNHHISQLDLLVITHPHKDHYRAIPALLAAGIVVNRAVFRVPDKGRCDMEAGWSCDYADVLKTIDQLRKAGARFIPVQAGTVLIREPGAELRVICAYDGVHTPVGPTDINDTSVVLMAVRGKTRALFAGDLNRWIGGLLAKTPDKIRAELLKAPHHGTEGTVPNELYEAVRPETVLVSAPARLWLSERSKRIRDYLATRNIPTYVSGKKGNVTVLMRTDGYEVRDDTP